eukprot:13662.XXX_526995_528524_1 [CDS] Oithona nana genome sequencing.
MFIELLILLISLITFRHYYLKSQLPAGPFSLPLLGTVGVIKNRGSGGVVAEAWQKFDKMYTLFLGSGILVVINDYKLTKELFAKEEFSGRSNNYLFTHIKGFHGHKRGVITTDGQVWAQQRRFALKQLRDLGFGRKSLDSVMIEEADDVIFRMLKNSERGIVQMRGTFSTAVINVLWQIVASKRFDPDAQDTKEMMDMLNRQFTSGNQRSFLPGFLGPFLPYNDFDKSVLAMKDLMKQLIEEHLVDIDYDNPRDFIDVYLKQIKEDPESYNIEHLIVMCVDFFQAGAETSSTTLLWAVMFMALNPKVQEKCFKEIHEQIGERPPQTNDSTIMVYTMATLMEIQRVGLIAESSLLHRLQKDTEVRGFKFKTGTAFIANLQKFLMDPKEFEDPKKLKPERFIQNGQLVKKEMFVPFGIGKRICMGESLAKNELFIFFVRILQRLEISVSKDAKPDPKEYTSGITRIPKPFYVQIKERNQ